METNRIKVLRAKALPYKLSPFFGIEMWSFSLITNNIVEIRNRKLSKSCLLSWVKLVLKLPIIQDIPLTWLLWVKKVVKEWRSTYKIAVYFSSKLIIYYIYCNNAHGSVSSTCFCCFILKICDNRVFIYPKLKYIIRNFMVVFCFESLRIWCANQ
jgi:hypothetical protein